MNFTKIIASYMVTVCDLHRSIHTSNTLDIHRFHIPHTKRLDTYTYMMHTFRNISFEPIGYNTKPALMGFEGLGSCNGGQDDGTLKV